MVVTKSRYAGAVLALLGGLACCLEGCVSGGADPSPNDGPECYVNADCPAWRECSAGVCVGFASCDNGCRNNEDCLDNVCRLKCESNVDCDNQGLVCGTEDTKHCKPAKNPTRPASQPQSGTGGTGSTGGTASGSGATTATGGTSGTAFSGGGMPPSGGGGQPPSAGVPGSNATGGLPGAPSMGTGGMTF